MEKSTLFGLVDKADENRSRELTQEYLTFLDDSVSRSLYYCDDYLLT